MAVDGYGLSRPRAGVGVYTKEVLHAMAVARPDCRMTVFVPQGVEPPNGSPAIAHRPLPSARFIGRHLQWPGRIRARMQRLGPGLHHLEGLDPAELPAVYNLALMLAHPAWYEGFGLPPLEAMACGTPVVVSNSSSLPEVVGDAGVIVPADSPEAWRQALEAVAGDADLAADLRRRGILRAAEFSWERSADLTWKVVDEVVTQAST